MPAAAIVYYRSKVPFWNKFLLRALLFLREEGREPEREGMIDYASVFTGGDLAVEFGKACNFAHRRILPHEGEGRVRRQNFFQSIEYAQRIGGAHRQHEVPRQNSREQLPVPAPNNRLFRHKGEGGAGDLGVVAFPRVPLRKVGREKFEVGQIHIDVGVDLLERGGEAVPARIVHNGDMRPVKRERLGKERGEVIRRHKVDVFRAYLLQFLKNFGEFFWGNAFAARRSAYLIILAEHAPQIAPAEEHRAALAARREAGLLKGVQIVFGNGEPQNAAPPRAQLSVRPAAYGAKMTFHTEILTDF